MIMKPLNVTLTFLIAIYTVPLTLAMTKVKVNSVKPKVNSHRKGPHCQPKGCNTPIGPQGRDGPMGSPGSIGIQGIQGVPGVQGVQGAQGPQGVRGYKGEKGQKGRRGFKGHKGEKVVVPLPPPKNKPVYVAFTVTMNNDVPASNGYKYNRVLNFDVIITNIGNGYDAFTAHFKPPVNGTYFFGFNGVSFEGQNILLHLVKDGQRLLSAYDNSGCQCCGTDEHAQNDGEGKCAGSGSNGGILTLLEGEAVWIELADGYGVHNANFHNYATFYGYLLFQTPPVLLSQSSTAKGDNGDFP